MTRFSSTSNIPSGICQPRPVGPVAPTLGALAGGNTAVLKPLELAVACSEAAARLVPKYFDPRVVAVVEGAIPGTTALLAHRSWRRVRLLCYRATR